MRRHGDASSSSLAIIADPVSDAICAQLFLDKFSCFNISCKQAGAEVDVDNGEERKIV